jgi:hypothetical protein
VPHENKRIAKFFLAQRVLRGATSPCFARPPLLRMISRVTRNHAGAKASRNHLLGSQARHNIVAQQSVHPTSGSLRVFKHFSWLEVGSAKLAFSHPAQPPVTQAVGRRRCSQENKGHWGFNEKSSPQYLEFSLNCNWALVEGEL